jgi:hypothetical protein
MMQRASEDEYLNPGKKTIDYRADHGSEDPRTPNSEVSQEWQGWKEQSQQRRLRYFIPDWDDLVDPRYDFENERYSNSTGPDDRGSGGWENEVFAHQIYDTPSYDGILVSREVLQKSKKKKNALEELADGNGGIHRYLRAPASFPVMGDCGAFGYVDQEEPPYSVDDVLDYYTRHGFNYGISVDHLVFGADDREGQRYRYDLTLENAQEFYDKHQAQGREWVPMAAVQGWNVDSYVQAAQECVAIGYDYLAVGGLVKSTTVEITSVLEAIRDAVGDDIRIHALGVARFASIRDFLRIGVTSVDSATYLRRAWTSRKDNFWTRDQQVYSALRVPGPKRALRSAAKKQAKEKAKKRGMSPEKKEMFVDEAVEAHLRERLVQAMEMEQECFDQLRAYGNRASNAPSADDLVELLDQYQGYVGRDCLREHYRATLRARPWERCDCAICERDGIEVVIFRGNNRNRRRGFHNTRVFYDLLGQVLESGESVKIQRGVKAEPELFGTGIS